VSGRRPDQVTPAQWVLAAALGALLLVWAGIYLALVGAQGWATGHWDWASPVTPVSGLATGSWHWTGAATAVAGVEAAMAAGLGLLVTAAVRQVRRRGVSLRETNRAARRMSTGRDQVALHAAAQRTAARLGVAGKDPGVRWGSSVTTGRPLVSTWEALGVVIASAGRHKTSALVVRPVLEAPGACLVTDRKRDVVAATRYTREQRGRCWVFDPQHIAGEEPTWWWDPLRHIRTLSDAEDLTGLFVGANASAEDQAKRDGFFDPKGQQLLSWLFFAAALDRRPVTDVYEWLAKPSDLAPDTILRRHGARIAAVGLAATRAQPEKTRAGIFATAEIYVRWLTNDHMTRWVTAGVGRDREFTPETFPTGTDTLYLLSREGSSSAAPLTTALAAVTMLCADQAADQAPGGRLNPPMVCALDEIANTCPWKELPDQYAHFRSKGILLLSYLQTWAQGVQIWGETRMQSMWDNAGVRIYAGGSGDDKFLDKLSKLIGDYDAPHRTQNTDARTLIGNASVSDTTRREAKLSVSQLADLPAQRMVVMAQGYPAMMVRAEPVWETEHAEQVAISERLYGGPLPAQASRAALLDKRP
jgi:type IV secretory pathway TraG/TraD family ATPase VirD4